VVVILCDDDPLAVADEVVQVVLGISDELICDEVQGQNVVVS
jgi:hypothetical protein